MTFNLYFWGLVVNLLLFYFSTVFCNVYPNSANGWLQGVWSGILFDIFVVKILVASGIGFAYFCALKVFKAKSVVKVMNKVMVTNLKQIFIEFKEKQGEPEATVYELPNKSHSRLPIGGNKQISFDS